VKGGSAERTGGRDTFEEVHNSSWSFRLDPVNHWAYWDKAFTDEECDELIRIGNSINGQKALLSRKQKLNLQTRDSQIAWLYSLHGIDWAFERMTSIVCELNERYFGFDLFGALEGFQFTKYEAPSGKYGKHVDCAFNTPIRKISFTLQLSDPKDYEGGDLCLHLGSEPEKMKKERGDVVIFPSYILHEVTPVTKGTRYSLVSWITGKPFK
jgi:PKHD-type hydroxylase